MALAVPQTRTPAYKSSVESFYSVDESHNIQSPVPKHLARPALTVQTSKTRRRYQSDEEMPSPSHEADYSEGSTDTASGSESDTDIAIDATIDMDALEPLTTPAALAAQTIRIVYSGKPNLIHIGRLAPMAPRRRRAAVDQGHRSPSALASAPVPIPRRSSRRREQNRSISLYEPPVVVLAPEIAKPTFSTPTHGTFHHGHLHAEPAAASSSSASSLYSAPSTNSSVTNFSSPHRQAGRPRPTKSHSALSTSSSPPPTLSSGPASPAESEEDVGDALLRESAEIAVRTHSTERARQLALSGADHGVYEDAEGKTGYAYEEAEARYYEDTTGKQSLDGPTPTSYDAYDPYGMEPPHLHLVSDSFERRGSAASVASKAKKGLKGLARAGRRGRRDAVVA